MGAPAHLKVWYPPLRTSSNWNRRDGQFHDLSSEAGTGISEGHSSRGMALGDLDNDGDLEIVTVNMHEGPSLMPVPACDSTASLFYHNRKDGTFDEVGVISGTAYNVDGMERLTFTFGVPTSDQGGKSLVIELPLVLTTQPDVAWRTPANSKVVAPKPKPAAAGKSGKSGK